MDITDREKAEKGEIDIKTALDLLGGRRDIYIQMLNRFAPAYGTAGDTIRQCLDRQDTKTAHRLAHNLKSAAAAIGLKALSKASRQLESALFHQSENIGECLLAFTKELDNALEMVAGLLASEQESGRHAPPPENPRVMMPPPPVLENIMESALRGEFTRLDRILNALELEHPGFGEFCGVIRSHAARYDDEAIVKYVKQED